MIDENARAIGPAIGAAVPHTHDVPVCVLAWASVRIAWWQRSWDACILPNCGLRLLNKNKEETCAPNNDNGRRRRHISPPPSSGCPRDRPNATKRANQRLGLEDSLVALLSHRRTLVGFRVESCAGGKNTPLLAYRVHLLLMPRKARLIGWTGQSAE